MQCQCQTTAETSVKRGSFPVGRTISFSHYPRLLPPRPPPGVQAGNRDTRAIPRPVPTCSGELRLKIKIAVISQTSAFVGGCFCFSQPLEATRLNDRALLPSPSEAKVWKWVLFQGLNWEPWIVREITTPTLAVSFPNWIFCLSLSFSSP